MAARIILEGRRQTSAEAPGGSRKSPDALERPWKPPEAPGSVRVPMDVPGGTRKLLEAPGIPRTSLEPPGGARRHPDRCPRTSLRGYPEVPGGPRMPRTSLEASGGSQRRRAVPQVPRFPAASVSPWLAWLPPRALRVSRGPSFCARFACAARFLEKVLRRWRRPALPGVVFQTCCFGLFNWVGWGIAPARARWRVVPRDCPSWVCVGLPRLPPP